MFGDTTGSSRMEANPTAAIGYGAHHLWFYRHRFGLTETPYRVKTPLGIGYHSGQPIAVIA